MFCSPDVEASCCAPVQGLAHLSGPWASPPLEAQSKGQVSQPSLSTRPCSAPRISLPVLISPLGHQETELFSHLSWSTLFLLLHLPGFLPSLWLPLHESKCFLEDNNSLLPEHQTSFISVYSGSTWKLSVVLKIPLLSPMQTRTFLKKNVLLKNLAKYLTLSRAWYKNGYFKKATRVWGLLIICIICKRPGI